MIMINMKKLLFFLLAALLCSCARSRSAADSSEAEDSVVVITTQFVKPLPITLSKDNLSDATVSASFSVDDFRWMGDDLALTVYEEVLYDAVEISSLHVGDTLLYQEQEMPVLSVESTEYGIEVNGGFEQGGATFCSNGGGTYRAVLSDDHSVYRLIGKVELILDENFTIHDSGLDPHDPQIVITDAQKFYLDMLEGYRREFTFLDTRVTIQDGVITDITRRWIP